MASASASGVGDGVYIERGPVGEYVEQLEYDWCVAEVATYMNVVGATRLDDSVADSVDAVRRAISGEMAEDAPHDCAVQRSIMIMPARAVSWRNGNFSENEVFSISRLLADGASSYTCARGSCQGGFGSKIYAECGIVYDGCG